MTPKTSNLRLNNKLYINQDNQNIKSYRKENGLSFTLVSFLSNMKANTHALFVISR